MIRIGAKEMIKKLSDEKKRIDGRDFEDFREVKIEYDISDNAEGSASVKLGNTEVYVGVKVGLGKTYDDTPDQGNLIVNAEVTPMAGEEYEPGPPQDWEVALARVIDRGIRESRCIDTKKLVITEGEKAWEVFVDVYVINDDGNAMDAGGIGAIAALKKSMIPAYDEENEKIDKEGEKKEKMPILATPIPITFAKVGEVILADPKKEEESASSATLTITVDEQDRIVSMQRQGVEGFSQKEIEKCLKTAIKKSKGIRKLLK